jgi:hypothetical protein
MTSNPIATDMSGPTTRILRIGGWLTALALLTLPAVAMQFTSEVRWKATDFLVAAVAFSVVGGLLELGARASANLAYRLAVTAAVATGFLTLWITLAVGIIGEPDNPLNLLYFAMIAVAAASAVTAGSHPRLLSRAMRATATVQALFCIAHVIEGIRPALIIDGFLAAGWFISGALFARAAAQRQMGLA